MNAKEKYDEFITLAQLYLFQQYSCEVSIPVNKDVWGFFKEKKPTFFQKKPLPQKAKTIVKEALPPPVPTHFSTPPKEEKISKKKISDEKKGGDSKRQKEAPQSTLTDPSPFSDLKKILKNNFPHISILETPSSPSPFLTLPSKEKVEEILILFFPEKKGEVLFITNLQKTLIRVFGYAVKIFFVEEKQNSELEQLLREKKRLILAPIQNLSSDPFLKNHLVKDPPSLFQNPLLPLHDFSTYLNQSEFKKNLWLSLSKFLLS